MVRCWACGRLVVGSELTKPADGGSISQVQLACNCGEVYLLSMSKMHRLPKLVTPQPTEEEIEKGKLWQNRD